MSTDTTTEDPKIKAAQGQTHWEMNSDGVLKREQNTVPMNNEVQLRNDREKLAQSMPIDTLAKYKEALATGDPKQMAALTENLTPGQIKLMKEIEARDPMTMVKGVANLAIATGAMQGLISMGQAPGGFMGFLNNLINPDTNLLSMSNKLTPNLNPVPGLKPGLDVAAAPSLPTPSFNPTMV